MCVVWSRCVWASLQAAASNLHRLSHKWFPPPPSRKWWRKSASLCCNMAAGRAGARHWACNCTTPCVDELQLRGTRSRLRTCYEAYGIVNYLYDHRTGAATSQVGFALVLYSRRHVVISIRRGSGRIHWGGSDTAAPQVWCLWTTASCRS